MNRVLNQLVDSARVLVGADYAALGIPTDDGDEFVDFLYTGLSEEEVAAIGPLPRQHGLLAATLQTSAASLSPDISQDPRFRWWPDAHPRMGSFFWGCRSLRRVR